MATRTTSEAKPPTRRRDAEENRQRILDVAIDVLAERPGATIDDIARAAGLVRRTLYGHFPTREDLIRAMSEDSISSLLALMADARARNDPPATTYGRFMLNSWRLAERQRLLLIIGRNELGIAGVVAAMRPVNSQVAELVAAAQAEGTFADHLPAAVLAAVLQSTAFALLDVMNQGRWVLEPRRAALASLVAAGMPQADAREIIDSLD